MVWPLEGFLVSSSNREMSYVFGEGFYLAFLKTISDIGFRFPLPKVQVFLDLVSTTSGSIISSEYALEVLNRFSLLKEIWGVPFLQVETD